MRPIKVLHISRSDVGGAGGCAWRIHHALLDNGMNSHMLVRRKKHKDDPTVTSGGHFRYKLGKILSKAGFMTKDERAVSRLKSSGQGCYTLPVSRIDMSRHPLVKEADIIHLHWINDYIDYPSFFKNVNKPIVWTLHDENLFHGVTHYADSSIDNEPLELKYRRLKEEWVNGVKNLSIVFLSSMMMRQFGESPVIANASRHLINNMVDCDKFTPVDKTDARRQFGLSPDEKVLTFVAADIKDPRKGLDRLVEAVRLTGRDDIKILAVGDNTGAIDYPYTVQTGTIRDPRQLSSVYSAGDVFVLSSQSEAFAQTPLEAMACGRPVVMYPISGSEELISSRNGLVCDSFSADALKESIIKALSQQYDPDAIRADVVSRFSPSVIASKYINVYNTALEHNQ